MRFDLSDDQQDIQRTARDLLASRATWEKVRAAAEGEHSDAALYGELGELGWPGIAVAEQYGGQGLGTVELAVLAEELGYACAPVPFLGTAMAAAAIEAGGSDEQKARWLPALASGEATAGFGNAGGLIADGPGAVVAVLADAESATLVEGGAITAVDAIDPTRRYGTTTEAGEPLAGDVAAGLDRAAIAVAAELVGIARRALEMSVAYVKDRKQFGVPVGAFQAVQHRAAQMLRDAEGARAAVYAAAWAADADPDRRPLAAAMAKAAAADAGKACTAAAIQLHGGIGFTWEADVHWLYKRAQLDAQLLGGAAAQRARIIRLLAEQRAVTA